MASASWGGNPPLDNWYGKPWPLRVHPREDDLCAPVAQIAAEDGWWNSYRRVWPTHMPRVRMDIQTAVWFAAANPYPWGCPVDLLCDSEPVGPLEHEWPVMPGETFITAGTVWRDRLALRVRMARQKAILFPDMTRRTADRQTRWEALVYNILTQLIWTCGISGLVLFALSMYSLWKNGL